MKTEEVVGVILGLIIVVVVLVWTITSAVECGNKGGRYLVGDKANWPVCVKEL